MSAVPIVGTVFQTKQTGIMVALPQPVALDYSYTGFSQSQGDNSFPGMQLDNDLASFVETLNQTSLFLRRSFNADGTITGATVLGLEDVTEYVQTALDAADDATASAVTASISASAAESAAAAAVEEVADDLAALDASLGALAVKDTVATADIDNNAVDYSKLAAGAVLQTVSSVTGAYASYTDVVPLDDTIPQNDEGTEILTVAITPKYTNSKLIVEAEIQCTVSTAMTVIGHIGRNATAGSVTAGSEYAASSNQSCRVHLRIVVTADSTTEQTFRLFVGPSTAGSVHLNGSSSARLFGGVANTYIAVTEVKA